ncbi:MAG: VWA domain-containing protein [Candidatus Zambryskibacteria bacterium]|nr:VWA domain-containing protein [Candidatus Zambryskibacteria bacterium]
MIRDMGSWSFRRQLMYLALPLLLVLGAFAYVFFNYLYKAPSCNDGLRNGDETGRDCGGSCQLLCKGDGLNPLVRWSESFLVAGSLWNAGAYVENPNISSWAPKATYTFYLYDEKNLLITSVSGETEIPKNKKFLVFYPTINTKGKTVKRTDFEFTSPIQWVSTDTASPELKVTHGFIEKETTAPVISGVVENTEAKSSGPVELSVIVYDGRQDAIGISRTYVDAIAPREKAVFGFTWPRPFKETQAVCSVPSDVLLVLDRSGSMASISRNPPEPLTSVKNTATNFVSSLTSGDQVGVVSFANEASNPLDHSLSSSISSVKESIGQIFIATTSAQNTNIGDGLTKATEELLGVRARTDSKKVIVLLTDGDPTDPKMSDQSNYPTLFAERSAQVAKDSKITLFTIGLGSLVNNDLLSRLASTPAQYFEAPTSADLASIYKKISKDICTLRPNIIEVIAIPRQR